MRTRTFVAVPLSESQRLRLEKLRQELMRRLPDIKWTEPENFHVTLVFLGEVDDVLLPRVCSLTQEAADASALDPFVMSLSSLGCFPHERRPRVLWVGIDAGANELTRLHEALSERFLELGCRREDRRFTPHVTLGRTKHDGPLRALGQVLADHRDWQAGEAPVRELLIMGSQLTREGPLYTVIGRACL
jgi:2'-5' RNA ligase